MRRVSVEKGRLTLGDDVIGFMEKTVTPYGTGAKVDCVKEYLGHRVYLVICKKGSKRTIDDKK